MTQEKGKKNIPGGWDSMSKGRDAKIKQSLGRPVSSTVAGRHGKTREEASDENALQRHNEADLLHGRTRTACQGGPGQGKARQGNLGESICVQTWLASGNQSEESYKSKQEIMRK